MICRLLTQILREANVSDIDAAVIQRSEDRDHLWWYILASPRHATFWSRFKSRYPKWRELARRYGASRFSIGETGWCPEFLRPEDLLHWLADTLELSRGIRNLLMLNLNTRC